MKGRTRLSARARQAGPLLDGKEACHDGEASLVLDHSGVRCGRGDVFGCGRCRRQEQVDGATSQVEKGAKQIGQSQVGPGFKEMFTGVGRTIVEGAKFSGENIKEFFAGKK